MRDVYTHRKGFPSPLLLLEFLDEEFAFSKRQGQVTQHIALYFLILLLREKLYFPSLFPPLHVLFAIGSDYGALIINKIALFATNFGLRFLCS